PLAGGDADKFVALMDDLDNNDDVNQVYANADIKQ
ncbi:MAG: YebC/PmpR family DNA-binding transcriptional regulator, partial [Elusimicrobia bacterium]|nr:YebC/PmpR family DNA-binding transcriptional regulator [Elusimicrobiota bacterium]